jgi:hypothetical protein
MSNQKNKVLELFGESTRGASQPNWRGVVEKQACPFLKRKCLKNRKSESAVAIGTCTVEYGKGDTPILICPHRLLEKHRIFTDCLQLLSLHRPGNDFHLVPEITIPGGSVDYFLLSARDGKVVDFLGIELQTLDTTGTVWPERQRFVASKGIAAKKEDIECDKPFGMNWKMTAKTILVQLHHKVETFEALHKHLVLVIQDHFFAYMKSEFTFAHLNSARPEDPLQFHTYHARENEGVLSLALAERFSTDAAGTAAALGMQAEANVSLEHITEMLQGKISEETLFTPV